MSFSSPLDLLPKRKLKTLKCQRVPVKIVSSNNSKQSVVFNNDFFRRLFVIARARAVDLKSMFAHELYPVPYSVAYKGGTLRKTTKKKKKKNTKKKQQKNNNNLLSWLEEDITETYSTPSYFNLTARIFDAMALVQRNRPRLPKNFW